MVDTMGNRDQPARTAGENVKRTYKNAEPVTVLPKKKKRKKRKKVPGRERVEQTVGLQSGDGQARPFKAQLDLVFGPTRVNPQEAAESKENLERQVRGRVELRESSKLQNMEIHRDNVAEGSETR